MNYLGHMILSGDDENILLGNFIGDHIRNRYLHLYSHAVQKGIQLHRAIDIYTDQHEKSRELRAVLFDEYRHRSRVILDLFYDHFLAANFDEFHSLTLSSYVQKVSSTLQKHVHRMPESAQRYFTAMKKYDWLKVYAETKGIQLILNQMSKRKHMEPMGNAVELLNQNYTYFKENAFVFLREAIDNFAAQKMKQ